MHHKSQSSLINNHNPINTNQSVYSSQYLIIYSKFSSSGNNPGQYPETISKVSGIEFDQTSSHFPFISVRFDFYGEYDSMIGTGDVILISVCFLFGRVTYCRGSCDCTLIFFRKATGFIVRSLYTWFLRDSSFWDWHRRAIYSISFY